jgi:hypothetical protein
MWTEPPIFAIIVGSHALLLMRSFGALNALRLARLPARRKAFDANQMRRLRLNQPPPVEDAVETGSTTLRKCIG